MRYAPALKPLCAAAIAFAALAPTTSIAATKTATFHVLVLLASDCNIVSAPNLDFGTVGVLTSNSDATSVLTIACTPGTAYSVGLDAGTGAGSTITDRRMASGGGGSLKYQLFRDSGRTQNWGNTPGTDTAGGTGNGSNTPYTIYGRVPIQTTPAVGSYASTVTVTITY